MHWYNCYLIKIIVLERVSSIAVLTIGFGPLVLIGMIVLLSSFITFSVNVIQIGMDQLHDSPSEDSVLFINWFVFSTYLGLAINKFIVLIYYAYIDYSIKVNRSYTTFPSNCSTYCHWNIFLFHQIQTAVVLDRQWI